MTAADAKILQTVVTPAGSETVVQIQISDVSPPDEKSALDAAAIRIDITARLPADPNPRIAAIHYEAIARAQEVLTRLAKETNRPE
jgi:hypothetical protein